MLKSVVCCGGVCVRGEWLWAGVAGMRGPRWPRPLLGFDGTFLWRFSTRPVTKPQDGEIKSEGGLCVDYDGENKWESWLTDEGRSVCLALCEVSWRGIGRVCMMMMGVLSLFLTYIPEQSRTRECSSTATTLFSLKPEIRGQAGGAILPPNQ